MKVSLPPKKPSIPPDIFNKFPKKPNIPPDIFNKFPKKPNIPPDILNKFPKPVIPIPYHPVPVSSGKLNITG